MANILALSTRNQIACYAPQDAPGEDSGIGTLIPNAYSFINTGAAAKARYQ